MVDLFEEVEEELRVEQYKKLALKLAPWVIGGLLAGALVALGAYGFVRYQQAATSKAATAYAAALDSLEQGDEAGAAKKLDGVKGAAAYKTLALMVQAGLRENAGKPDEAVKLFDQAAAAAPGGKAGLILADTARLKAAWAVMDDKPYAEIEKRLQPLTQPGRPVRALAQEALNMAMLNAGMVQQARVGATRLTAAPDAPAGVAQRAQVMISVIDSGVAGGISAVAKAEKALPPPQAQPMQITPEMIQQLRAQAAAQGGGAPAAPGGGGGQ